MQTCHGSCVTARNMKQRVPLREETKDEELKDGTFCSCRIEGIVILAKENSKEKKSRGYDFSSSPLQLQIETLRTP